MTCWGLPGRSLWWMTIHFSLYACLLPPSPFAAAAWASQRGFSEQSQMLIRRGARDEITLGFGMSSLSSPVAVTLSILTCYNNFLWADTHWFDTNGSNRLHQELPWRVVDWFSPTVKIEWAIISKGKLDPACICINTPKMTQLVPHPAQQSGFLLVLYLVSVFGWETSNVLSLWAVN